MNYDTLILNRKNIFEAAAKYGIKDVRVFGSVADEQDTKDSDIDFLVNMQEGTSLLELVAFQRELERFLHTKVDVVPEKNLHWYIKDKILQQAREL